MVKGIGFGLHWSLKIGPKNRAIVSIHISRDRSGLTAYSFLINLRRRHGARLIITDGGLWYALAARWARLSHTVIVGGDRSYVERFIESLKDKLRGFDTYFQSLNILRPRLTGLSLHGSATIILPEFI